jgi:hypothetical protein
MLTRLCHSVILVNSVLTGSGSKTRHHANSIYPEFPQQLELESDKEKKRKRATAPCSSTWSPSFGSGWRRRKQAVGPFGHEHDHCFFFTKE